MNVAVAAAENVPVNVCTFGDARERGTSSNRERERELQVSRSTECGVFPKSDSAFDPPQSLHPGLPGLPGLSTVPHTGATLKPPTIAEPPSFIHLRFILPRPFSHSPSLSLILYGAENHVFVLYSAQHVRVHKHNHRPPTPINVIPNTPVVIHFVWPNRIESNPNPNSDEHKRPLFTCTLPDHPVY